MSEYTSGPWIAYGHQVLPDVGNDLVGLPLATAYGPIDVAKANASLIAAAPGMLDALRRVMRLAIMQSALRGRSTDAANQLARDIERVITEATEA